MKHHPSQSRENACVGGYLCGLLVLLRGVGYQSSRKGVSKPGVEKIKRGGRCGEYEECFYLTTS